MTAVVPSPAAAGADEPTEIAIRLRAVTKTFPGSATPAVASLDLEIPRGDIVVLIGPSGCGKTTTLRMINRLIEPSGGTITIDGADVRDQPVTELRRGIGYVIQQIGLFPHRTIGQNIGTVPRMLGWDKARIATRVDELVELVGLDASMLDRYPSELSGGQQQRVGVARALAADPPVLLMDEPFGAVDPIVRGRLQDELLSLQAEVRKTIVLVTHDIDEAIKIGDRIAIMNVGGVLEQFAAPDDLLADPANAFVEEFLGAERSLKRLTLASVADLEFHQGPVVDADADMAAVRAVLEREGSQWAGATEDGRFLGWLHESALNGKARIGDHDLVAPAAQVSPDSTLREALEIIMNSRSAAAVVSDDGRFGGVVTLEQIREGLAS
ncbi:ATP-binding cassette domain-containing protein [soil metagenome]